MSPSDQGAGPLLNKGWRLLNLFKTIQVFITKRLKIPQGLQIVQGKIMAISPADKAVEYMDFARHCLKIVRSLREQNDRIVHREMAAEWINLARMITEDAAHSASDQLGKARIKAVS
jgi:hypothetical protein